MKGDRLTVGLTASLSGQFRSQGTQALAGVSAWVSDANALGGIFVASHCKNLPLVLKFYNDESSPRLTRALTEKLIVNDKVDILLGPYSSVLTMAAAGVADKFQKVLWNHGGASDEIYRRGFQWVVGILTPASRYLLGIIDLVKERDSAARKLAILHSGKGSFSRAVATGVESYALKNGFEIVFKGEYESPASDFSLYIKEIAEKEPDVLIGVGRIQDDMILAQQLVLDGVRPKTIALVAAGIGQFKEELGDRASGFMGPSQWEPEVGYVPDYGPSAEEVSNKLATVGLGRSDYPMAQAYAAGLVAQRCVEDAGTTDSYALRGAAHRLDFTTFYGRFKLDPETGCQVGRDVVIVQWQGNKKVIVWPKEIRQAEAIYPLADSML